MRNYMIRRSLHSIIIIMVVVSGVFLLTHVLGDPIKLMIPAEAPIGQYEAMRRQYGFDRPVYVQFADFWGSALRGDFGWSFRFHSDAFGLVVDRLPKTVLMAAASWLLALLGMPLGVLAAQRPRSVADRLVNVVSFAAISLPDFWLGLMLIVFFAIQLQWLPTSGYGGFTGWQYILMPAVTLAVRPFGRFAQLTRASMIEEMAKQYVATARSKGLSERAVVYGHVVKNASIAPITLGGYELAGFMNGSVVVETIFGWPGLGLLTIQAIYFRDLNILTAVVFLVAIMVMLINLTVDMVYTWLDPRIRYG